MLRPRPLASLAGLLLAVLAACAAVPTPYGPADEEGLGYRERRIEADRFRVTFVGNDATSRETVESYLLYRAAELTLANGYDHFVVTERFTEKDVEYAAPLYGSFAYDVYGGYHPHGPLGAGFRRFPYYAYGYPWSAGVPYPIDAQYEATAYVVLRRGEKPPDAEGAYDAREVLAYLAPVVVRAEE